MKKAKIMLMAIAVVGVVGGALAFKSKNFGTTSVFQKNGTTCKLVGVYSTVGIEPTFTFTNATLSPTAATCTASIPVYAE